MRSARTKAIIKKIAGDEGLTIKQIEEIVYSFFRFTSKRMKEGNKETYDFKSIRLFKFGIFRVKEGRKFFLKRKYANRNKNTRNDNAGSKISGRTSNDERVKKK